MVMKSVCEIQVCAKFSSFILLWGRELFGVTSYLAGEGQRAQGE